MTEPIAPPVPPYTPPNNAAVPAKRSGPSRARRFGDGLGTVIGQALAALVVFPLLVGLVVTGLYLAWDVHGDSYDTAFVAGYGLAALCGAFVLAVKWGFTLFIRYWPIILLIVGGVIAWKAFT